MWITKDHLQAMVLLFFIHTDPAVLAAWIKARTTDVDIIEMMDAIIAFPDLLAPAAFFVNVATLVGTENEIEITREDEASDGRTVRFSARGKSFVV